MRGLTCAKMQVKTTKPRRYLVRPNQGLVDVGGSTDVTVILQQKDAEELIKDNDDGKPLGDSTDKFLVQSTGVPDEFYDETIIKPAKVRFYLSLLVRNKIVSARTKQKTFRPCGLARIRKNSQTKN